mgnify:CR=1 FL=1
MNQYAFAPGLLSQDAAAFYLNIGKSTLNELQAKGQLIPKKIGGKRGFARTDLDAYIASLPDWPGAKAEADS